MESSVRVLLYVGSSGRNGEGSYRGASSQSNEKYAKHSGGRRRGDVSKSSVCGVAGMSLDTLESSESASVHGWLSRVRYLGPGANLSESVYWFSLLSRESI
jgi:hypothetical protein